MAPQARKTTTKKASPRKKNMADMPIFFYMPDAEWENSDSGTKPNFGWPSITFNCAEQFMMYCKAATFHDTARQAQILVTSSPKGQKALDKATVDFTDEMWDPVKSAVVEAGNVAKFSQYPHLARKLLCTHDRLLCEAAPRDRVWGIGYSAKHAMSQQKHWGENRLGKALMATRQRLRTEQTHGQRPWNWWQD